MTHSVTTPVACVGFFGEGGGWLRCTLSKLKLGLNWHLEPNLAANNLTFLQCCVSKYRYIEFGSGFCNLTNLDPNLFTQLRCITVPVPINLEIIFSLTINSQKNISKKTILYTVPTAHKESSELII